MEEEALLQKEPHSKPFMGTPFIQDIIQRFKSQMHNVGLALGPILAALILGFVRLDEDHVHGGKSVHMLAILSWVCVWWVTEAVPVAVASLAPLFLFPMLGIMKADAVAMTYMNDTIALVLGSFILALAVERYNLHQRLALKTLLFFGGQKMEPRLLLLGFCVGPAFVSMFISNTATAMMMVPLSIGMLHKLESGHTAFVSQFCPICGSEDFEEAYQKLSRLMDSSPSRDDGRHISFAKSHAHEIRELFESLQLEYDRRGQASMQGGVVPSRDHGPLWTQKSLFSRRKSIHDYLEKQELADIAKYGKAVVLAIAYSVSIGGLATLTGTGVNLILAGVWSREFPTEPPVSYLQWILFGLPLAVILLIFCWAFLCLRYCSSSTVTIVSQSLTRSSMREEFDALGPFSFAEKAVLTIFMVLGGLWMTRSIGNLPGWGSLFNDFVGDGTASVFMATFLFIIPNKRSPGAKLMDWGGCKQLPWDIVLLLGGGFALAEGIKTSGLSVWISQSFGFLKSTNYAFITPVIALIVSLVTEFTSNNAAATIFLPLLADVALSIHRHPLFLMLTGAISASYAFMLPISTPPNAIAYATGYLKVTDTISNGILLKCFGIATLSVLVPTLGIRVFGME